ATTSAWPVRPRPAHRERCCAAVTLSIVPTPVRSLSVASERRTRPAAPPTSPPASAAPASYALIGDLALARWRRADGRASSRPSVRRHREARRGALAPVRPLPTGRLPSRRAARPPRRDPMRNDDRFKNALTAGLATAAL